MFIMFQLVGVVNPSSVDVSSAGDQANETVYLTSMKEGDKEYVT